jgi:hypothetical protein
MLQRKKISVWIAIGDLLVVLTLSVSGYLFHYAGHEPFSFHWLSTFLPLCLGWFLAAVPMHLYDPSVSSRRLSALWRAALAGVLGAPFATMLRGLYLNAAVPPIFMIVLTASTVFAMAMWRSIWAWISQRKNLYG